MVFHSHTGANRITIVKTMLPTGKARAVAMLSRARVAVGLCCALGLLALAACSTSVQGDASAEASPGQPARAATIDTAPCGLLTSGQQHQLGVNAGVRSQVSDDWGGVVCTWRTISTAQGGEFVGRVLRGNAPTGTSSVSVNNLPTTQFVPPNLDERAYCVFLVAVASGETLWAQYGGPNQPGLSHRIACAKAQTAASYMVSTFGALSR